MVALPRPRDAEATKATRVAEGDNGLLRYLNAVLVYCVNKT